jgi:hypothetical protein
MILIILFNENDGRNHLVEACRVGLLDRCLNSHLYDPDVNMGVNDTTVLDLRVAHSYNQILPPIEAAYPNVLSYPYFSRKTSNKCEQITRKLD